MTDQRGQSAPAAETGDYADTWVVVPTYNEAENIEAIGSAILERLPGATLLVVDDNSPDGTGGIADAMAAANPKVRVHHRPGKQGLGRAYIDGFRVAIAAGAGRIVQMDADWSHDPEALPALLAPIPRDADLVVGSRYVRGGRTVNWGVGRLLLSRCASLYTRVVLGLPVHDTTAGFAAWAREALSATDWSSVHAGGYVFQIEMKHLARRRGARIVEVPIVFRDRRVGQSKMSRRIIVEALILVLQLRWNELRGRGAKVRAAAGDGSTSPESR